MVCDHENVPKNEKLTVFLDDLVEHWMKNKNVPIELWNINKYRRSTNNADEVWNSKLSNIIGKQQPDVFLLVQRLKGEAKFVSLQLKSMEPGEPPQNEGRLT